MFSETETELGRFDSSSSILCRRESRPRVLSGVSPLKGSASEPGVSPGWMSILDPELCKKWKIKTHHLWHTAQNERSIYTTNVLMTTVTN